MDKKSIDHELNKLYPDFPKCTAVDFSFTKYVEPLTGIEVEAPKRTPLNVLNYSTREVMRP